MRNQGKQPRFSGLPEPVVQLLIQEKLKGEEDWMHPDRARYEIEFRFAQRRMEAWWKATGNGNYPEDLKLPERVHYHSSRRRYFISKRYMEILKENMDSGVESPFDGALTRACAEADALGYEDRNW